MNREDMESLKWKEMPLLYKIVQLVVLTLTFATIAFVTMFNFEGQMLENKVVYHQAQEFVKSRIKGFKDVKFANNNYTFTYDDRNCTYTVSSLVTTLAQNDVETTTLWLLVMTYNGNNKFTLEKIQFNP